MLIILRTKFYKVISNEVKISLKCVEKKILSTLMIDSHCFHLLNPSPIDFFSLVLERKPIKDFYRLPSHRRSAYRKYFQLSFHILEPNFWPS